MKQENQSGDQMQEKKTREMSQSILGLSPLHEDGFRNALSLERKRTERSKQPFILMLVEHENKNGSNSVLKSVMDGLQDDCRDTDVVGWYKEGLTVGVIYTCLSEDQLHVVNDTLLSRLHEKVKKELGSGIEYSLRVSFHSYPDDWYPKEDQASSDSVLYADIHDPEPTRRAYQMIKRVMDVLISAVALLVLLPVFAVMAVVIKLTSNGPVFFCQKRVGQHGQEFEFIKFRSMYVGNDVSVHQEYVRKLIESQAEKQPDGKAGVYKLTHDPRITPFGRWMRKTSLDEIPQFWNVLRGEMSVVGPRPPLQYELDAYKVWHRRRVLEAKPGITGLWQVTGRSSVGFDEMVRLDLRYAASWTPWMDLKIVLMTPFAIIKGTGAH